MKANRRGTPDRGSYKAAGSRKQVFGNPSAKIKTEIGFNLAIFTGFILAFKRPTLADGRTEKNDSLKHKAQMIIVPSELLKLVLSICFKMNEGKSSNMAIE